MHPILRLFGIAVVFGTTCVAWLILGAVMESRTHRQAGDLGHDVSSLWGVPQSQKAPELTFKWTTEQEETRTEIVEGQVREIRRTVEHNHSKLVAPGSTSIDVGLDLDQRLRGLMWYALYDVDFAGHWTYVHNEDLAGTLAITFDFPVSDGLYDSFRFVVDDQDLASELRPEAGRVAAEIPVQPGQRIELDVTYASRGMSEWRYEPAQGVANLEDFSLTMTTDFDDIDFPASTLSPSERSRQDGGWRLAWTFEQIITGHGIGMAMPVPIQPGQLASELSYSAPISLFFFFLVLFVLGTMRGIDIHPINYLFLGASFFAFHLLFGYMVDHVHVAVGFGVCSVVSVLLVVSYLRLVVSPRFALVEAGAAQLVYLVGFSLAHFWDGFTGLTVTILSVLTLFVLMQLTGRIKWSDALASRKTVATREQAETPSEMGQPMMGRSET